MRQGFGNARASRRDTFKTLLAVFLLFVLTAFFGPFAAAQESAAGSDLGHFLQRLWPAAQDAGVSREIFDSAVAGLTPEPGLLRRPQAQAEFTISIPSYVAGAVTPARVAQGRALASSLAEPLATIEQRSGVPSEIALAILGVESNFGSATGGADTLRVLATLAYAGHRGAIFSDEFVAALVMLQRGDVTRARLRGSWAGAMGQPQFLPSAYLKYATRYEGDAAPDIWTRPDRFARLRRQFPEILRLGPAPALGPRGRAAQGFRLRRLRPRFHAMAGAGPGAGRGRDAAGERAGEPLSSCRRGGAGLSHHR